MSGVLTWHEYAGAEHAQIGGLEFFVSQTSRGAELYADSSSFDFGYGGTSHASVEAAKAQAEEIARHTHDALSQQYALALQWQQPQPSDGSIVARVGQWVLHAKSDRWTIFLDSPGPVCRLLIAGEVTDPVDPVVNIRAAQATLRNKLGVVFRVEVSDG